MGPHPGMGGEVVVNRFKVSDHAVLRYLERGCGVDIDALRTHIIRQAIGQLGTYFPYRAGAEFRTNSAGLKFHFRVGSDDDGIVLTTVTGTQDLQSKRAARLQLRKRGKK